MVDEDDWPLATLGFVAGDGVAVGGDGYVFGDFGFICFGIFVVPFGWEVEVGVVNLRVVDG